MSVGGAAFSGASGVAVLVASPWQEVHVIAFSSRLPFTCVAGFTVVAL